MPPRLAIIIMGVTGTGKSTLGEALALNLGVPFIEGDAFHPAENVRRMAAGVPLQDADRWPWLSALGMAIVGRRQPLGVVATCSALKRSYRDRLREIIGEPLRFVCLVAERETIAARMQARKGHYMPGTLIDSQLKTLELPDADESAIVLAADTDVAAMLASVRSQLGA